jgi:streptogramin lyase
VGQAGSATLALAAVALLVAFCSSASAGPGEVVVFHLPHPESHPQSIAAGPDGQVWFTEKEGDAIGRITAEGEVTEFPLPAEAVPYGITAGPDGNVWFTEWDRIGRITPSGEITEFPLPGESRSGGGITTGPDGNLWFAERDKIGRITPAGVVTEFPLSAENRSAVAIAAGPDGNLWFTEATTEVEDPAGGWIGRINTAGQIVEFPLPPGSHEPQAITPGPDGNVWFTNAYEWGSWKPQVGRITPQGEIVELPIVNSWEQQIAAGPHGSLWVTGFWGRTPVTRINAQGETTGRYPIPEVGEFGPSAIAAGLEGNMWVTLPWQGELVRITPGPPMPLNRTSPSISGAPEPGKTLRALPGTWTENPTSYNFRWETCAERGSSPIDHFCEPISGASGPAYVVTEADYGRQIRVRVTARGNGVESDPVFAAPVGPVALHLEPSMGLSAKLLPKFLPRNRQAPAALSIGFTSEALNPPGVPQLGSISFELASNIHLHTAGHPSCPIKRLYAVAAAVRRRCSSAVVGHGTVRSEVKLGREYVPVKGTMTAYFDHESNESPHILGRVTTSGPTPLTYVLPFRIEHEHGRFGTRLVIPQMRIIHGVVVRGGYIYTFPYGYGRISSFSMLLRRGPNSRAHRGSFVTATCPALAHRHHAGLPLLKATLSYSPSLYSQTEATALTGTVSQRCRVAQSRR